MCGRMGATTTEETGSGMKFFEEMVKSQSYLAPSVVPKPYEPYVASPSEIDWLALNAAIARGE
jgi:hypothetical protein